MTLRPASFPLQKRILEVVDSAGLSSFGRIAQIRALAFQVSEPCDGSPRVVPAEASPGSSYDDVATLCEEQQRILPTFEEGFGELIGQAYADMPEMPDTPARLAR
jgi:hypothetical protein